MSIARYAHPARRLHLCAEGDERYVVNLSEEQRNRIALYLNFDMIGSPNAGYFIYDGDNSDNVGAGPGPTGSAVIEQTFETFYRYRNLPFKGTDSFANVNLKALEVNSDAVAYATLRFAMDTTGVIGRSLPSIEKKAVKPRWNSSYPKVHDE